MTVLELAELVKELEEKFGVSAAAPVAVAAAPAAAAAAEPAEEKTEFDVILKEVGADKIKVIKVVREARRLRLRPQGSQGTGRQRSQAPQGRRHQGSRRGNQEEVCRSGRDCRNQVSFARIKSPFARMANGDFSLSNHPEESARARESPFAL